MNEQAIATTAPVNRQKINTSAIRLSNMAEYFEKHLAQDVERFRNSGIVKSGYSNLDEITNLYPGLYFIGAIPSLGKTTFVHQMGEQIAEAGSHVLYFSLEQSTLELATKSIARSIAKEDTANALTSLQIRTTDLSDPRVISAVNRCKSYSDKITIIECTFRATIDNIIQIVLNYIKANGEKPVVIIDYLQAIQADPEKRMTTKDNVDYHAQRLKELQTDLQLIMLVISSFNRQNYLAEIDFEAFKESGGIEYTADVLWGLQLNCFHENLFSAQNKINEKRKRIKEAKRALPRKIELVCLKNRFGISSYSCFFDYYPQYDLFIPDPPSKKNTIPQGQNTPNSNAGDDGWTTISDGLENEIPWDTK